ncbi:ATP-binding protein [Alteromonas sp. KUL49]|uniref:ATP-binding protein n=1 Tax=Alteromonas sp. KUL49 TaxID=2480798 RepID=UPI00102EE2B4|nr:ATP-binding protein [Alteromonas sp. KUL49]TAP40983.1 hypothetical protein EYS00_07725 [Alteromonas sp. KUL49]GEA11174.1 two-component sensor histidine kinase [Alteromonas sp. KUL49]
MFKSFIGLWLLVFTPLFFLIYPSSFNPIIKFNTHVEEQRYIEIYGGTFDLIESALPPYNTDNVASEFNNIRGQFGFDIVLTSTSALALNEDLAKVLSEGGIVFVNDEPEYLLKRLYKTDSVIQLYTDFSADEEIYNGAKGTVALIKQRFAGLSATELTDEIASLGNKFPYDLSLYTATQIAITPTEKEMLHNGGFFWREPNASQVSFYIPVDSSNQFLVANLIPTTSVNASVILILIGVFIVAISIGMFLWVYPLWRDLNRLVSATEQLGQGELGSRAFVSSISVVAKLGRTFNLMADKLSQLLIGQRTLTNAIAHDLRTPLYRLKFAVEMLDDTADESKKARYKTSIDNSIKDLDHLVNQTLMLSRYSNEKELVTFVDYNITAIVLEEFTATSSSHVGIHWELHQVDNDVRLSIDRLAVKRAINNLLSNANKFATSKVHVHTYIADSKQNFVIEVSDDGPGIPDNEQESIFIPFTQSSSTNPAGNNGHGLGLAIVRQIAKWHDGQISVSTSSLGGAKFTLELAIRNSQ